MYAPFGGSERWGQASRYAGSQMFPGAVDGPQRWQSVSAADTTLAGTAALGYKLPDQRLSFAIGATLYRDSVSFDKALNGDGSDDLTAPNGALKEGRAYLDVSGINAGLSGGVYWEPTEDRRLRLGVSYTSQPGLGTMRLKGTFSQKFGITSSDTTDVELLQSYPDIVRAGVAYRVSDDVDLRLNGEFDRWSVYANECLVHPGQQCALNARRLVEGRRSGHLEHPDPLPRCVRGARRSGILAGKRDRDVLRLGGVDSSAIPSTSRRGPRSSTRSRSWAPVGVRHPR